eukprot:1324942-Amorphochlora_amoeboformis.AAC.2
MSRAQAFNMYLFLRALEAQKDVLKNIAKKISARRRDVACAERGHTSDRRQVNLYGGLFYSQEHAQNDVHIYVGFMKLQCKGTLEEAIPQQEDIQATMAMSRGTGHFIHIKIQPNPTRVSNVRTVAGKATVSDDRLKGQLHSQANKAAEPRSQIWGTRTRTSAKSKLVLQRKYERRSYLRRKPMFPS